MKIKRPIKRIFIHTLAHDGDASVKDVDRWHKDRGWSGIGYHYLIRRDGTPMIGRPVERMGAHVKGFNSGSIGIAFEGHGDHEDFTEKQYQAGYHLIGNLLECSYWLREQNIKRFFRNPSIVLGHREAWTMLLDRQALKTCPGKKVDMRQFRIGLIAYLTVRGRGRPVNLEKA